MKRRAPKRGESWIPPLGPPRTDDPLEPPVLDDLADDAGDDAEAAQIGPRIATQQAATPDRADPFDDAATSFLDDLGEPDEAAALESSVAGR